MLQSLPLVVVELHVSGCQLMMNIFSHCTLPGTQIFYHLVEVGSSNAE